MKVHVIAVALFVAQLPISSSAQSKASKADTEKWILSKLTQYASANYREFNNLNLNPRDPMFSNDDYDVKDRTFRFEGQFLVATYNKVRKNEITNYKVSIPVYYIEDVYCYQFNQLWFTTKEETIIENDMKEHVNHVEKSFNMYFMCDAETDLALRLKKAFVNLKRFYKKPPSKELF